MKLHLRAVECHMPYLCTAG